MTAFNPANIGMELRSAVLGISEDFTSTDASLRIGDHANCSLIDNDGLRSHIRTHDVTIIGVRFDGNHANQDREMIAGDFAIPFSEKK